MYGNQKLHLKNENKFGTNVLKESPVIIGAIQSFYHLRA